MNEEKEEVIEQPAEEKKEQTVEEKEEEVKEQPVEEKKEQSVEEKPAEEKKLPVITSTIPEEVNTVNDIYDFSDISGME